MKVKVGGQWKTSTPKMWLATSYDLSVDIRNGELNGEVSFDISRMVNSCCMAAKSWVIISDIQHAGIVRRAVKCACSGDAA